MPKKHVNRLKVRKEVLRNGETVHSIEVSKAE